MKKCTKPSRSIMKPEAPARRLPGKSNEGCQQRILARREIGRAERRHVGDEDDGGEGIGEAVDADRDREGPELAAAMVAVGGKPG